MKSLERQCSYLSRNRGSVLIVTMWVLVCFSILGAGLYGITSSRIRLARELERRVIGEYLAKAACVYFKAEEGADETAYDSISELNQTREQSLGRGKFKYTLKDEESKININTSSIDTLSRLPGLNKETVENIYESKLKPFHAKEEILLVDGVSEDIYDGFKDFITVYTKGDVNINTASPEVLKVLGLDDGLIGAINDFRAGPDGKELTADDGVFTGTGEIIERLRAVTMLYEEQEARLLQLISQNILSTESKNYMLEIETTVLEKPAMRYNIIMDREKIKRWREF